MRQEHSDTIYGIVPEYEHHEVRYAGNLFNKIIILYFILIITAKTNLLFI